MREVESVGPLQQNKAASGGGEAAARRINKPRARAGWRGPELEERGYGETDGDKEMQNERGLPGGEQTQRVGRWKAAELTDRQTDRKERERDEG